MKINFVLLLFFYIVSMRAGNSVSKNGQALAKQTADNCLNSTIVIGTPSTVITPELGIVDILDSNRPLRKAIILSSQAVQMGETTLQDYLESLYSQALKQVAIDSVIDKSYGNRIELILSGYHKFLQRVVYGDLTNYESFLSDDFREAMTNTHKIVTLARNKLYKKYSLPAPEVQINFAYDMTALKTLFKENRKTQKIRILRTISENMHVNLERSLVQKRKELRALEKNTQSLSSSLDTALRSIEGQCQLLAKKRGSLKAKYAKDFNKEEFELESCSLMRSVEEEYGGIKKQKDDFEMIVQKMNDSVDRQIACTEVINAKIQWANALRDLSLNLLNAGEECDDSMLKEIESNLRIINAEAKTNLAIIKL